MFQVSLQQFSGPLDKLLELIEAKNLEITEINLAAVTGDFLDYIRLLVNSGNKAEHNTPAVGQNSLPGKAGQNAEQAQLKEQSSARGAAKDNAEENQYLSIILADFLVMASKLVLIKSKTLLPDLDLTEEEKESVEDLETRLTIYREFTGRLKSETLQQNQGNNTASFYIKKAWDRKSPSLSRQLFSSLKGASFFYSAPNLTLENLSKSLNNLVSSLKTLMPKAEKARSLIISLENKIKELINKLKEATEHSFLNLAQKKSREEVVVTFLAFLHLFKKNTVNLEQKKQFGDIIVRKL